MSSLWKGLQEDPSMPVQACWTPKPRPIQSSSADAAESLAGQPDSRLPDRIKELIRIRGFPGPWAFLSGPSSQG